MYSRLISEGLLRGAARRPGGGRSKGAGQVITFFMSGQAIPV